MRSTLIASWRGWRNRAQQPCSGQLPCTPGLARQHTAQPPQAITDSQGLLWWLAHPHHPHSWRTSHPAVLIGSAHWASLCDGVRRAQSCASEDSCSAATSILRPGCTLERSQAFWKCWCSDPFHNQKFKFSWTWMRLWYIFKKSPDDAKVEPGLGSSGSHFSPGPSCGDE